MDNAPHLKRSELTSMHLADTYNGSKLPVKFLTASGWVPLLNLGYFELRQLPFLIGPVSNHFQRYLVQKSVKLLNPKPNESILDLACGHGWTTQFIAKHGSKTAGLDLCEPHIHLHNVTLAKWKMSASFKVTRDILKMSRLLTALIRFIVSKPLLVLTKKRRECT